MKNPTYAGVYTFGKTREVRRVLPDGTVRSTRRRRAREEWTVLIEDHHDGYVTWAEFLATEAKLAANNTQRGARPVREGSALCQGTILCGTCGGRVGTRYSRKDRQVTYKCADSTARRRTVTAETVDDAVASLLLQTVTPQQIQVALATADEVVDRQVRTHRAAELAVERARYEADRADSPAREGAPFVQCWILFALVHVRAAPRTGSIAPHTYYRRDTTVAGPRYASGADAVQTF